MSRWREFLARHPAAREALCWALPAMLVGTLLRALLTIDLPYAFWGADSRSYFSFAHELLARHAVSLDEKRRYLYPLLLTPVALLPGAPLRWLAVLQHALGVVTLWPLAYLVRRSFRFWRLWIVPCTLLCALLPIFVWYEHELLGETLFFASLLWAFAGWVAWVNSPADRSSARFWCFLAPFAVFLLTKPAGRFAWPGVLLGLLAVAAWRRLGWKQFTALGVLACVSLTVGSKKQGAWLLYTATFPLTVLDSPAHADYKREIRDLVEPLQQHPGAYYLLDDAPFAWLENPTRLEGRPLWQALQSDARKKSSLYLDLALEGIKAHPAQFAYFGFQRLVASANLSQFNLDRFTGRYVRERTEHFYAEGERDPANRVRFAFGLPAQGAIPGYAEFQDRLAPHPSSSRLPLVRHVMSVVGRSLDLVHMPRHGPKEGRRITRAHPTALGVWLACAAVLALAVPGYRRTFGVWTVVIAGYLGGVFLFSQQNVRYFAPAWTVLVPLLFLPLDGLVLLARNFVSESGVDAARVPVDPPHRRFHLVALASSAALLGLAAFGTYSWAIPMEREHFPHLLPTLTDPRNHAEVISRGLNYIEHLKNQGLVVQQRAFERDDQFPLYGSSELVKAIPVKSSYFFRGYPTGFSVLPVGKAGSTSLIMLQRIAALGEVARGRQVAISLSPSWFYLPLQEGHYQGNFSHQQARAALLNEGLSFSLRSALAGRLLMHPKPMEHDALLCFLCKRMTGGGWLDQAGYWAVWPLARLRAVIDLLQDHFEVALYIKQHPGQHVLPDRPAGPGVLDWDRLLALPAPEAVGPAPLMPADYMPRIRGETGFQDALRQSAEWDDLELLVKGLHELGMHALILCMPPNGSYLNQGGIPVEALALFSARLHRVAGQYGATVETFDDHLGDLAFRADQHDHLSAKGWMYYNRELDRFYHGAKRPAAGE